ncbi:MAG: glutamate racemase [Marinisporobacter sp.]|jgi:glutamate racemase|nr:glutamate racemase [Marinisporobacter sp.]
MDNRAIGVFDSGVGGLTAIPHLMKELPNERFIYFGDIARAPYGSKSKPVISEFTEQIVDFLIEKDVKMIVIACNTITVVTLDQLKKKYPHIPIIGIVQPAAEKVASTSNKDNNIGIIATSVTINQKAYSNAIQALNPELKVFEKSCPLFVPIIEEGLADSKIMECTVQHYLDSFVTDNSIDKLVLGCTHYPLVRKAVEKLYPHLEIINPSFEVVNRVKASLIENDLLADAPTMENSFYASSLTENFLGMVNSICNQENVYIGLKNFDTEITEK